MVIDDSPLLRPDRRQLLRLGGILGAGALTAGSVGAEPWFSRQAGPRRVVLVAFAGGVRSRETFGQPANIPNLVAMASEGAVYHRARTSNLGHFGAALSLLTGIAEARGIRDNARGEDPTVFEYVRKELQLSATDVWLTTSGGAQSANYGYGLHPEFGASYGASTLDGDGIFNEEFRKVLASLGAVRPPSEEERSALERMRAAIRSDQQATESLARVERYILDELSGGTTELRGVGASDAKALRVARNLLAVFRPRLLGVTLNDADVAHGNYNAYVEVIRRNDRMLGELWKEVRSDPELADSTAFIVVPEFGRDADLNSRRGLDHGDGSDDLNYVSVVCWGRQFRRGYESNEEVRTIDVCPTVCKLLGARARYARGKVLPRVG